MLPPAQYDAYEPDWWSDAELGDVSVRVPEVVDLDPDDPILLADAQPLVDADTRSAGFSEPDLVLSEDVVE